LNRTLKQEIFAARKKLSDAGIEDSAFNVDQMAAEILKVSAGLLPSMWNDGANEAFSRRLESMVNRRCCHEPLQYIVENWAFLDFDVITRPGSLIPRPETEDVFLAASRAVKKHHLPANFRFIDVCTGSGVLGLATALRFPEAIGWLVDISSAALETAAMNLLANKSLNTRLKILRADMLSAFADESVDLIIANPPYVDSKDMPGLMPEVLNFEPHLALDGGPGGLVLIEKLMQQSCEVLRPGGLLVFEHGHGQRLAIVDIIDYNVWVLVESGDDMQGNERFFILLRK